MASVHTTNMISSLTLTTAVETGTVSFAAYAIQSPIGALGGAIFGAVRCVSAIGLRMAGIQCLNANHPQASSAAKTLVTALEFFGSFGVAWAVLAAAGYTLTVPHMITLTAASIAILIPITLIVDC